MTDQQLIEKLQSMDPTLNVKSWCPEIGLFYGIEGVWDNELDNDNETPICSL